MFEVDASRLRLEQPQTAHRLPYNWPALLMSGSTRHLQNQSDGPRRPRAAAAACSRRTAGGRQLPAGNSGRRMHVARYRWRRDAAPEGRGAGVRSDSADSLRVHRPGNSPGAACPRARSWAGAFHRRQLAHGTEPRPAGALENRERGPASPHRTNAQRGAACPGQRRLD